MLPRCVFTAKTNSDFTVYSSKVARSHPVTRHAVGIIFIMWLQQLVLLFTEWQKKSKTTTTMMEYIKQNVNKKLLIRNGKKKKGNLDCRLNGQVSVLKLPFRWTETVFFFWLFWWCFFLLTNLRNNNK